MIFLLANLLLAAPDLPPLPDPLTIELKIAEPAKEKLPLDSLLVTGSFGNPSGLWLHAAQGYGDHVFEADGDFIRGKDFSSFLDGAGALSWLWLLPRSWSNVVVDYKIEDRDNRRQQMVGGAIAVRLPVDLFLDCPVRQTELYDIQKHNFFALFPKLTYDFHLLGSGQAKTVFSYQPHFRNFLDFSLDDQIDLNSALFFRPGITFQTPENYLGVRVLIGSIIKRLALTVELTDNDREPLRFDSLYFNQPFSELNPALGPSRSRLGAILKIKFMELELRYERATVDSFVYWTDLDQDSLFEPHNRDLYRDAVGVSYTCQWQGLKNFTNLGYEKTVPQVDLSPRGQVTDSLSFSINRFELDAVGTWIDSRLFDGRSLRPTFDLSSRINYRLGLFNFFFGVDNILNTKYEALPYRFHVGRRFSVGCSLAKAI